MMKLLKILRGFFLINLIVRVIIKKSIKLNAHWPVSGYVDVKLHGHDFKFYSKCDDHTISELYYGNGYENQETSLFLKLVANSNTFYDIGANVGIYSVLATSNKDIEIHSFEPYYFNYDRLKKNMNGRPFNGNRKAVGDIKKDLSFYVPDKDNISLMASVDKDHSQSIHKQKLKEIKVEQITLNDYIKTHNVPDLIKIDVEGHEINLLQGASDLYRNYRPITIMEILYYNSKKEFIEKFFCDYGVYLISGTLLIPVALKDNYEPLSNFLIHPVKSNKVVTIEELAKFNLVG